jgi:hypothetical protein
MEIDEKYAGVMSQLGEIRCWLREDQSKTFGRLLQEDARPREVAQEVKKQLDTACAIIYALRTFDTICAVEAFSGPCLYRIVDRVTDAALVLRPHRFWTQSMQIFKTIYDPTDYLKSVLNAVKVNTAKFFDERTWCCVLLELGTVWDKLKRFVLVAYSKRDWETMADAGALHLGWDRDLLRYHLPWKTKTWVHEHGVRQRFDVKSTCQLTAERFEAIAKLYGLCDVSDFRCTTCRTADDCSDSD